MSHLCAFCHADSHYVLSHAEANLPVCFHCLRVIIDHQDELMHALEEKMRKEQTS